MRLVFCGTPQFAVPTLEALVAAEHEVSLAISQPDKPVGRSGYVLPTPVKQAAQALGIPVMQPEKLKGNEALRAQLLALEPDAIVVVAYGRILPQWMLDLPRYGCVNGHASLLPRWRGAAPIQWAIASGDTETGVTTMRLDAGLDTGPMLLKRPVTIAPWNTAATMFETLSRLGAQLMVDTLSGLRNGSIQPEQQDDSRATLAPLLSRDDGRIDFGLPAQRIEQRFRGFQPWPGTFTTLRGKKLIVHAMHVSDGSLKIWDPGTVVLSDGAFHVACGENSAVVLQELQLEGKKRMSACDFLRGFQVKSGEVLGR